MGVWDEGPGSFRVGSSRPSSRDRDLRLSLSIDDSDGRTQFIDIGKEKWVGIRFLRVGPSEGLTVST